eukprot:TRINITY_DN66137_c5_g1_i1.p1 TRINITY_DN66137_c5_g1~~TRINITY_DN66137_c5_g1_i1.p1  ORF type:complete len:778 (+),score=115.05 TRINITY_DN66137_c5_g1_i1:85-2418(+)
MATVSLWLRSLELDQYTDVLVNNEFNSFSALRQLEEEDLALLNINKVGAKRKLLNGVKQLRRKHAEEQRRSTPAKGEQATTAAAAYQQLSAVYDDDPYRLVAAELDAAELAAPVKPPAPTADSILPPTLSPLGAAAPAPVSPTASSGEPPSLEPLAAASPCPTPAKEPITSPTTRTSQESLPELVSNNIQQPQQRQQQPPMRDHTGTTTMRFPSQTKVRKTSAELLDTLVLKQLEKEHNSKLLADVTSPKVALTPIDTALLSEDDLEERYEPLSPVSRSVQRAADAQANRVHKLNVMKHIINENDQLLDVIQLYEEDKKVGVVDEVGMQLVVPETMKKRAMSVFSIKQSPAKFDGPTAGSATSPSQNRQFGPILTSATAPPIGYINEPPPPPLIPLNSSPTAQPQDASDAQEQQQDTATSETSQASTKDKEEEPHRGTPASDRRRRTSQQSSGSTTSTATSGSEGAGAGNEKVLPSAIQSPISVASAAGVSFASSPSPSVNLKHETTMKDSSTTGTQTRDTSGRYANRIVKKRRKKRDHMWTMKENLNKTADDVISPSEPISPPKDEDKPKMSQLVLPISAELEKIRQAVKEQEDKLLEEQINPPELRMIFDDEAPPPLSPVTTATMYLMKSHNVMVHNANMATLLDNENNQLENIVADFADLLEERRNQQLGDEPILFAGTGLGSTKDESGADASLSHFAHSIAAKQQAETMMDETKPVSAILNAMPFLKPEDKPNRSILPTSSYGAMGRPLGRPVNKGLAAPPGRRVMGVKALMH